MRNMIRLFLMTVLPISRRVLLHRYPYMHRPAQLMTLIATLDDAIAAVPGGAVVEVGCASGHTTVMLADHLLDRGHQGPYLAFDTFGGFTAEDKAAEKAAGRPAELLTGFTVNHRQWVEWTLAQNPRGVPVRLIQADAGTADYTEIPDPIAFVLLDVDVERPTAHTLRQLWPRLAPGGIILLDDCRLGPDGKPALSGKFGGGHAALLGWVKESGVPIQYASGKYAIIRKPQTHGHAV